MTIWHLLIGMALCAPLAFALGTGAEAGIIGIVVALALGSGLSIGSFYGLYMVGGYICGDYKEGLLF
jgi:hypothetical protein